MNEVLPLFPLNTVLFPKSSMPLKIFEPRYKAMITECIEKRAPFGIALIQQGPEAGGVAQPFEYGCAAEIKKVSHLENGDMKITVEGTRRFRVVEELQREPHWRAEVRYLDEEPGSNDVTESAKEVLKAAMGRYANLYYLITSKQLLWEKHFRDPVRLSWYIADLIDLENPDKQDLLEVPDAAERLRREVNLLVKENEKLEEFWGKHKFPRN